MSIYLENSGPVSYDSVRNAKEIGYHYVYPPCTQLVPYVRAPKAPANQKLTHVPFIFQDVSPYERKTLPTWKDVKKHRLIKMTNHEKRLLKKESFIVWLPRCKEYSDNYPGWGSSDPSCGTGLGPRQDSYASWESAWTLQRVIDTGLTTHFAPVFDPSVISEDEQDVRSQVIASANTGFDVLTGLAEFPETLELILKALQAARHPLKGMKEVWEVYRKRDKKQRGIKFHADLMSQWMQYRYAIMPLVMQIEDAVKLLQSNVTEFSTSREGEVINDSTDTKPLIRPSNSTFCYQKIQSNVRIKAVAKSKYDNANTYLMDVLTFNPFQTAWELIPLSFVVDWFVNIGDMVFNLTSKVGDLSIQRAFCSSIQYTVVVETWIYDDIDYRVFKENPAWSYDGKVVRPPFTTDFKFTRKTDQLLFRETYTGYRRLVFDPSDAASLHFNPNLNWRRMIDAYVLSFKTISGLLRDLKRS